MGLGETKESVIMSWCWSSQKH